MTYEDLRQAALSYRRKHGGNKLDSLIENFGGDDGLESVPPARWDELMAALQTDGATPAGKLAEIGRNAFAKRKPKR